MTGDAVKGLKHFADEDLVAEIQVPSQKDRYWGLPKIFNAHLFNSSQDDYVVRVYKVVKSVRLPNPKRKSP